MKLYLRIPGGHAAGTALEPLNMMSSGDGTYTAAFEDRNALMRSMNALVATLPPRVLDQSFVLLSQDCETIHPAQALAATLPFNTFYAQQRHPWLLGDLDSHVQMHFQPIVDFTQPGTVFAYEALCRMVDPVGQLLNGEEAFKLARQVNRADELDHVCTMLALEGKAHNIPPGTLLFVNVLPQTILQRTWLAPLLESMERLGIDRRDIVIEIVESEEVAPELLAEHCDEIRKLGLRIALDDMGSGFNGLRTLAAVRADFIKIDRTIVHEAQGSRARTVLLDAIISMAQRLGCTVVAEGLERVEDITFCQDLGLIYAQGYYFAMPQQQPATQVAALPKRDEAHRSHVPDEFRIAEFITPGLTIDINASIAEARQMFRQNPDAPMAVVLDRYRPLGVLRRGKVFSFRQLSLGACCDPLPKLIRHHTPPEFLARSLYLDRTEMEPWVMVNEEGSYLGVLLPMEVMSQLIARKANVGSSLHPLSHLTTGPVLRQSLDISLRNNPSTQLVYIDLDHFKAYNDRYGFIRGDAMIRLLAEILRHVFNGQGGLLLGHIGGDDFVVILDQARASLLPSLLNVISRFYTLATHLYDSADLERGFFTTEDGKEHPVASVSIAVVNGSQGELSNSVAAAERAAILKKIGKSAIGSIIVVEGDPPQLVQPMQEFYSEWQSRAIAALQSLLRAKRSADPHVLDGEFRHHPFFEVVFELEADGRQRYPNWINPNMYGKIKAGGAGMDRSQQEYYIEVAKRRQPYLSSIYLSTATEDFCLTLSLPILDAAGMLEGVLVADINISAMAMLSQEPASATIGTTVH
ncbi:diguanylate cyclase [Novimethylophilus kurashikiensis]|uniref:Diguanylate cyclase n=1 Tax=Novimethylophilus kurashikiensis TaxID=1825523 RepID=A0A2R5F5C5_9PROT|nr:EAL domain-containing protein [Novimethylophilus kurashikiensis]GBG13129.1 diguanylate cyclase [Novimethylophilus kurashikiensis]